MLTQTINNSVNQFNKASSTNGKMNAAQEAADQINKELDNTRLSILADETPYIPFIPNEIYSKLTKKNKSKIFALRDVLKSRNKTHFKYNFKQDAARILLSEVHRIKNNLSYRKPFKESLGSLAVFKPAR